MAKTGNQNRRLGMGYEQQAADFLEARGYQILHRNFYSRYGEIDLVARQEKTLEIGRASCRERV